MPIKLEGLELSIHKKFLTALMGANSDSLALSQLWVCTIDYDKLNIIGAEMNTYLNVYEENTWNTAFSQGAVNNRVLSNKNFSYVSTIKKSDPPAIYLFAQGINFIADGISTSRAGLGQSGAIKGLVMDSRLDLNAANITFLESNVSFVDGFLRPWSVLVSHRSLKSGKLRCDIALHCLEKWELNAPLKVRKSMIFKNAIPISVDSEEYNYSGDKLIQRQVQFAFDRYELEVRPEASSIKLTGDNVEYEEKVNAIKERKPTYVNNKENEAGYVGFYEQGLLEVREGKYNLGDLTRNEFNQGKINVKPYNEIISIVNVDDKIGQKKYNSTITSQPDKPSLLGGISQTLSNINNGLLKAQAVITNATTSVARGLDAIGFQNAAGSVMQLNMDIQQQFTRPLGQVIGTGQSVIGGGQEILRGLRGGGNPQSSADAVTQSIIENTRSNVATITPPVITANDAINTTVQNAKQSLPTNIDNKQEIVLDVEIPKENIGTKEYN